MKTLQHLITIIFGSSLLFASCKKEDLPPTTGPSRVIEYNLFTEKDFSGEQGAITFSIFIKTTSKVLFDSTFSRMDIKDIPAADNKIVIRKLVPNNDQSDLAVGFRYVIENVGQASHIDTCNAGQTYKLVNFSFK